MIAICRSRTWSKPIAIAFLAALRSSVAAWCQEPRFIRGNSNGDTALNISDPQTTLGYLFLGSGAPPCLDAADANDDGRLDLADAIFTLGYLFLGGPAPPPPYPDSNLDPTPDSLGCGGE